MTISLVLIILAIGLALLEAFRAQLKITTSVNMLALAFALYVLATAGFVG